MKFLSIKNLAKFVDNTLCFSSVNLDLMRGEICCISADNDERTKLFISVLANQIKRDSGSITFKSEELTSRHIGDKLTVAWFSSTLFLHMSGYDNIRLKCGKRYSKLGIVSEKKLITDVISLLDRFKVTLDLNGPINNLSMNKRAIIDLISAILLKADITVLYKAARYLTLNQFETLEHILEEKKKVGNSILYVPANIEEVQLLGDRFLILSEDGFEEIREHRSRSIDELKDRSAPSNELNILSVHAPIYNAKKLISKSISDENLDFVQLAESVGLKYHVFRREFKEKTGYSPKQYLIRLKIEKAKEKLLQTNDKIEDIAESLGFTDPLYFSRIFKNKEKISPQNFRKQKLNIYFE